MADTTLTPGEDTIYAYDLLGNLDLQILPNGVITDYIYNDVSQLTELIHYIPDSTPETLADNDVLASCEYTLADSGRRLSVVETHVIDPTAGTLTYDITSTQWVYDDLNRLIEEHFDFSYSSGSGFDADRIDFYTYDLVGNRVKYEQDADADSTVDTTVTYTFDANDRLTVEVLDTTGTEDDRYSVYSYDATQQTSKTVTEGTTSGGDAVSSVVNEYNLQGRMAKVTTTADGVVTEVEYEYTDAGLRVKQTITVDSGTPVVTEYLFDNGSGGGGHTGYAQVVEEFIDDVLAKIYTLGHDVIGEHHTAAAPGGAQALFHLHDGHGSTRMLLDDLVELVQRYAYDAYGNHLSGALLASAASALTSLLYSGEFFDKSVNQQYLRARWYDAATGRFNRLDPFAGKMHDPQSLHKYAYAHGDPINEWDPEGRLSIPEFLTTSIISGVLISLGTNAVMRGWQAAKAVEGGATLRDAYTDFAIGLAKDVAIDTITDLATAGLGKFAGPAKPFLRRLVGRLWTSASPPPSALISAGANVLQAGVNFAAPFTPRAFHALAGLVPPGMQFARVSGNTLTDAIFVFSRKFADDTKKFAAPAIKRAMPSSLPTVPPGATYGHTGMFTSQNLKNNMMDGPPLSHLSADDLLGYDAHHIIPKQLANHPLLSTFRYNLDDAGNGIFLTRAATDGMHGNHPHYTTAVRAILDQIEARAAQLPSGQQSDYVLRAITHLQRESAQAFQEGAAILNRDGASVEMWFDILSTTGKVV